MLVKLKNKKALVGGSSRGLGNAVAKQLALSGAKVTLVARNEKNLIRSVKEISNITNIKHDYLVVDYNDFEDYKLKIGNYLKKNPIDILVNNTQGPKAGDVENVNIDDYQKSFDLLFKSVVYTTTLAVEHMKKNKWGRVINMASISVKEPLNYLALSNSIRSALTTWSKTLANQIGSHNITVNNVLTGYFNTERIKELNLEKAKKMNVELNEVYQSMEQQVPMRRIGEPQEFANLVTFLASELSSYINGINIPIDGGLLKSL